MPASTAAHSASMLSVTNAGDDTVNTRFLLNAHGQGRPELWSISAVTGSADSASTVRGAPTRSTSAGEPTTHSDIFPTPRATKRASRIGPTRTPRSICWSTTSACCSDSRRSSTSPGCCASSGASACGISRAYTCGAVTRTVPVCCDSARRSMR
ncbi:hypothetical protein D9M72_267780 [compost metagenome]